ncbi:extracellular solute-binding protein [Devosia aurantiaca]|uniref:Extracellular solute-binding protein n=1 Tax=Devosia aurantiaca TaxID=2714858 RepID=A0A6M1SU41_9HYPH|nr:extracellular solute-binding protein [Devosia aurantiaca]NGP16481.1 extracellular solute-binding protein [Devosia aurantiaca]
MIRQAFFASIALLALGVSLALAQEGPITVYNAQHETLAQEWATGFTEETGIPVIIRQGSDLEVANQILQEGANSPADVFLTENSPGMVLVDNAGLFEPLPRDILDAVPAQFRPENGNWTGIAARSTVFAYNKDSLGEADLPKTMAELADPAWQGRWAASPSGADFQAIVAAYLVLEGEAATLEWLQGMAANAVIVRGNRAALAAANNGEVDGALIYHYYWFGDQAGTGESSANTSLHYFGAHDPGAFVSISGGGVLASSQHKEEAEAFLRFITTKGQDVLRDGSSYEYAIGVDHESNAALPPLNDLGAPQIDPTRLDTVKAAELMTEAGLL